MKNSIFISLTFFDIYSNVLPTTTPFSLVNSLPKEIPEKAEHWKTVLHDLEHIILPGLAHWQSPHFHAYFPSSSSAGSIIGELLIAGIGVLGFSWVSVINIFFFFLIKVNLKAVL